MLKVAGPYNFDLVLERLALDPLHAVDKEKRSVKVPLTIDGKRSVVEVKAIGTTDEPQFELIGEVGEKEEERVAEIFQWRTSLHDIHTHFSKSDLSEIFEEHRGTPLILDFDVYECLLKCIVHQQLNLSFARTLTQRFVVKYGSSIDGVYFYPTPEVVANLTVKELREIQFSGRKAEYVIGIAEEITAGRLDLESLYDKSDEEIMKELTKLRGVGPWTVQNVLMFGLGRPNLFPTGDIGIQNALKKLYGLDRKPTLEEMENYQSGWEPYLSYASLYLWRSIE